MYLFELIEIIQEKHYLFFYVMYSIEWLVIILFASNSTNYFDSNEIKVNEVYRLYSLFLISLYYIYIYSYKFININK